MAKRTIPIFDTSVFPDYESQIAGLLLSSYATSIVFFELVATSIDSTAMQKYASWRSLASRNKQLLNPTATDWWETSKAVRRLYLMKEIQPTKLRTLRNDALIARLSVMHGGLVVTYDVDDFQIIQKVMPELKVMPATEFFN